MLQLTKPRDQAIADFSRRGREHDGGNVKGKPAGMVHDRFLVEVQTIHDKLKDRADQKGVAWDDDATWKMLSYAEAAAWVAAPENGLVEHVASA